VPRGADPERPDAHGLVKRFPPIAPIGGNVLASYASEDVPETFLAACIRIGDELDPVGTVNFFEPLREKLEHLRTRFLCALDGDGNRDPPDRVQRNALFSLSKNPSPASYVASVDRLSNSSSSRRCSSVSCRGTATRTNTR
jgi:hypothetical protein